MKEMKNYLIISPTNEYGGVNLDVAFLASIASETNNVEVISLGDYYENSSVFLFDSKLKYDSLNRILYNNDLTVKYLTNFLNRMKPLAIPKHFRVENKLSSNRVINTKKKKLRILESKIIEADVIILCSQLTSSLMSNIIDISSENGKPIIFRTTGSITKNQLLQENLKWFRKVQLYIHHSYKNKRLLENFMGEGRHIVVDQNAYFEKEFLNIPIKKTQIRSFFTLSRLHHIKGIETAIKAFQKICEKGDVLNIYGSGEELERLQSIAKGYENIIFKGKISFQEVPKIFRENDCLLITSIIEAGPYTAIESMAAGVPIISSKVGAMEERLTNYEFFYSGEVEDLAKKLLKIKSLDIREISDISINLRKIYFENFSEKIIKEKMKKALTNI